MLLRLFCWLFICYLLICSSASGLYCHSASGRQFVTDKLQRDTRRVHRRNFDQAAHRERFRSGRELGETVHPFSWYPVSSKGVLSALGGGVIERWRQRTVTVRVVFIPLTLMLSMHLHYVTCVYFAGMRCNSYTLHHRHCALSSQNHRCDRSCCSLMLSRPGAFFATALLRIVEGVHCPETSLGNCRQGSCDPHDGPGGWQGIHALGGVHGKDATRRRDAGVSTNRRHKLTHLSLHPLRSTLLDLSGFAGKCYIYVAVQSRPATRF